MFFRLALLSLVIFSSTKMLPANPAPPFILPSVATPPKPGIPPSLPPSPPSATPPNSIVPTPLPTETPAPEEPATSNNTQTNEPISSVDLDEDAINQIVEYEKKVEAVIEQAETTSKELEALYKKHDSEITTFTDELDKSMADLDNLAQELKSYISSQQDTDDKEVKKLVDSLDFDLRDFSQSCTNCKSMRKDIEALQKELVTQNGERVKLFYKILNVENGIDIIKADFLDLGLDPESEKKNNLQKINSLYTEAQQHLAAMQQITSGFKGKVETITGKINQIKSTQANLEPKKTELVSSLKNIVETKERNSTNEEAELLVKLNLSGESEKDEESKLPHNLMSRIEETSNKYKPTTANENQVAVTTFLEKMIVGAEEFISQAMNFVRKLISAIFLEDPKETKVKSKDVVKTDTTTTTTETATPTPTTETTSPFAPKSTTPQTPVNPFAPTPTTPPANPFAPIPATPAPETSSIAPGAPMTSTTTTTTADKTTEKPPSTTPNSESKPLLQDAIQTLGDIFAAIKKLGSIVINYIGNVYKHLKG